MNCPPQHLGPLTDESKKCNYAVMRACAREKGLCCHFSAFSPKKIGATQKGCVEPPYLCTRICEKAGAVARKCFDGSARGRRFESGCPLQDMVQRLERWLERPCACCLAFPAFGPDAVGRRYFVLVAFFDGCLLGEKRMPPVCIRLLLRPLHMGRWAWCREMWHLAGSIPAPMTSEPG